MKERGHLIRNELPQAIKERIPSLQSAFNVIFDDLETQGKDGMGPKTQAPWVRLFSKKMSPNPRNGFYLVIHFSSDGSSFFITVGVGGTVWSEGTLRSVSDEELLKRTSWAKSVIQHRWETLNPFSDQIFLGSNSALPRTFEKATVIARCVKIETIYETDLETILFDASERLNEIYLAQLDQRDLSQGEIDSKDIFAIVNPLKINRNTNQGFGLSASERAAVELRAMFLATNHLQGLGYECTDTSRTESYDLLVKKDGAILKIEVKGTTSDICDSFLMTKNEVDLHRNEKGSTGLVIVSKIKLTKNIDNPKAEGGAIETLLRWDIDLWKSIPKTFQITR